MDKLSKKLKGKQWRKRGNWISTVITAEMFGLGEQTLFSKKLGYPFKRTHGLWLCNGDFLDLQSEWEDMKKIAQQFLEDDKAFFSYADDCLARGNNLVKFPKYKNINKLSNKELANDYEQLCMRCKEFLPFMFSLNCFDIFLSSEFDKHLEVFKQKTKKTREEIFQYKNVLTFPCKKIYTSEERMAFMDIATWVQKNGLDISDKQIEPKIKKHVKKFAWLNMVHFQDYPYDEEFFKEKLKSLLKGNVNFEYNKILLEEKDTKKKQIRYMKEIKSFKKLYTLSKTIQVLSFVRSFRVDVIWIAFYKHWKLIDEISERLDLKESLDIKYLSSSEVSKSLNGHFDYHQAIADRKRGFCSLVLKDDFFIILNSDCKNLKKNINILSEEKKEDIIKGNVAYLGKVKGYCKIIKTAKDIEKVVEGDILITAMTDPNYIPAMEKAVAFVTDEGGLLCHAAILAREMKKPCIIGTKIATKVLKDGDLVEVDASKGIIKKLNK
jgi:phosphohistidine swiveling domain-containing protein